MKFGNREIHYQTDPKGSIPTSHEYCSHFCCSNPKRLVAGFNSSEQMLCLSLWTRSIVMKFSLNLKSSSILGSLRLPQSCYVNIGYMPTIFPSQLVRYMFFRVGPENLSVDLVRLCRFAFPPLPGSSTPYKGSIHTHLYKLYDIISYYHVFIRFYTSISSVQITHKHKYTTKCNYQLNLVCLLSI